MPVVQAQRVSELQQRFQVRFELSMNAASSVNNYEYLDILDRAWSACGLSRRTGGTVVDIGCASFWYAAALQAFFEPEELLGVEVEGHRLFRNGHTRIDYARGYLAELPNARFLVQDFRDYDQPADVLTAWFPFLTPQALLAWRLPLDFLTPQRLVNRIYHNLRPAGLLVMVNHGPDEYGLAHELCIATGMRQRCVLAVPGVLSVHRRNPAFVSCWERTFC